MDLWVFGAEMQTLMSIAPGTTKTTEVTWSHMKSHDTICIRLLCWTWVRAWLASLRSRRLKTPRRFAFALSTKMPHSSKLARLKLQSTFLCGQDTEVHGQLRFGMFLQRPLFRPPVTTLMKQNTVKNTLVASLVEAYFLRIKHQFQSPGAYLWIYRTEVYHAKKFEQPCHSPNRLNSSESVWSIFIRIRSLYIHSLIKLLVF